MSKISKNIKHLRQLKKWSQMQLADALEIPRARIGAYEEERCDPPIETVVKISNLFHVAVDALVKCDLSKFDASALIKVDENRILFPIMVDAKNQDQIEVVTMKASAGYLTGYADPEYIEKLSMMNLPFKANGKHRAFPIVGDSMPPLKKGCYVVGKFVEAGSTIDNGKTYVVVTREEGIVYKRLYKKGKLIELHSDNEQYSPYSISQNDIIELWQFVCSIQVNDNKQDEASLENIYTLLKGMKAKLDVA
jgi:DNA-binding XRE family transcriptional regulator